MDKNYKYYTKVVSYQNCSLKLFLMTVLKQGVICLYII